jgi:hypothetical protein
MGYYIACILAVSRIDFGHTLIASLLMQTRKAITIVINVINIGIRLRILSRGWGLSRMDFLVRINTKTAMIPANNGDITHEEISAPMPVMDQSTQSRPTAPIVMPATLPTTACVADTTQTKSTQGEHKSKNKRFGVNSAC